MDINYIVVVVWDSCQEEAARAHAPTLRKLSSENLSFTRAVSPSGWSLPSHVSLFSGKPPSQHRTYQVGDLVGDLPLCDALEKSGFHKVAVSSNGFASPRYGFATQFDEFISTVPQIVYPEGLDIQKYAYEMIEQRGEFVESPKHAIRAALGHTHPIKSLANVGSAGLTRLIKRYPRLAQVPHPWFVEDVGYRLDPEMTTKAVTEQINQAVQQNNSLFLFANYMNCHWPYNPPARHQETVLGETVEKEEIKRLNELAKPWEYLQDAANGKEPTEEEIDRIRELYQAEIRHADESLSSILSVLDDLNIREETLLVVTADHGEVLGTSDDLGDKTMGHEMSCNNDLYNVPLIIANPEIPSESLSEWMSLLDLPDLLLGEINERVLSEGVHNSVIEADQPVIVEYPRDGREESLREKYPDVPERFFARDLVTGYHEDWKVVVSSEGDEVVTKGGETAPVEQTPDKLVTTCYDRLEALHSTGQQDLTEQAESRLEELGYL